MKHAKVLKTTTNRREYHIIHDIDDDPYMEDYGSVCKHNKGCRGYRKSIRLWPWQMRMYWKHNRKTQWREK